MEEHRVKCLHCGKTANIRPDESGMVESNKEYVTLYRYTCPHCRGAFWRRKDTEQSTEKEREK